MGPGGSPFDCLCCALPVGEHRVHEGHVGVNRLPGEGLCGVCLALLLVGQSLGRLPVLLGLGTQVVDGLIEEDLGELCAPILSRCATIGYCLKGLHESVGELIGGLVYLLLLLLVHAL